MDKYPDLFSLSEKVSLSTRRVLKNIAISNLDTCLAHCLHGFAASRETEIYISFTEGMSISTKRWKEYADLLYLSKHERGFVALCKYNLIPKSIIKCLFYRAKCSLNPLETDHWIYNRCNFTIKGYKKKE